MLRLSFFCFLIICSGPIFAQHELRLMVFDEQAKPLSFVSAAVLNAQDSTLEYYGITDNSGFTQIKNIKTNPYLLQIAYLGYETYYKSILPQEFPKEVLTVILKPAVLALNQVEVSGERIPLLIKGDTIEYNAGAFKTAPDANTEDLLKKLPGVEVDRAGNIKAQGEQVNKVLVDGKEFFSNDPKVATKNFPADAINKVQVFDKKSDEAEFSGIDDGLRNKTINLLLKENKKQAWLGEFQAGYGTDNHYNTHAKAYRFTKTDQFALLGMMNNINQFGFSFNDYIDFSGGIASMVQGEEGFRINVEEDELPINFGQQILGLNTNGAAGANYTHEKSPNNKFNISYLGSGIQKDITKQIVQQIGGLESNINTNESQIIDQLNFAQKINSSWLLKFDSTQQLSSNLSLGLDNRSNNRIYALSSFDQAIIINTVDGISGIESDKFGINLRLNYLKKLKSKWKLFKIGGDYAYTASNSKIDLMSNNSFYNPAQRILDVQNQNNDKLKTLANFNLSANYKLGRIVYIEPQLKLGLSQDNIIRKHISEGNPIDSLSPKYVSTYSNLKPGIIFKRNETNLKIQVGLRAELGQLDGKLHNNNIRSSQFIYFIPRANIDWDLKRRGNFRFNYETYVSSPDVSQLLPIVDASNAVQLFRGNPQLNPELIHDANLHWMKFDQFTSSSIFARIGARITQDKINMSRNLDAQLIEHLSFENTGNAYNLNASIEYDFPVRLLGIKLGLNAEENYTQGNSRINNLLTSTNQYTHKLGLTIENRKKKQVDLIIGADLSLSKVSYAGARETNNDFSKYILYSELSYTPMDKFNVFVNAEYFNYTSSYLARDVSFPIVRAGAKYFFLKNNKASIQLEVFDVFNSNSGLERRSDINYFIQEESSILQRYALMSLKYRLNKFESKGGLDIKVNGRRGS